MVYCHLFVTRIWNLIFYISSASRSSLRKFFASRDIESSILFETKQQFTLQNFGMVIFSEPFHCMRKDLHRSYPWLFSLFTISTRILTSF